MPKLRTLLADKGTEFTNAFATTPLCCPSRSSSLTGLYAQHHGVLANGDIEADDEEKDPGVQDFNNNGNEERIVAKAFRTAGYRTGFVGKYLNGYDELLRDKPNYVPPYWDDWYAFPHAEYYDFMLVEQPMGGSAKTVCYPSSAGGTKKLHKACKAGSSETVKKGEAYSTDVLVEKAVAFIDAAASTRKPFFLYFAPKAPHGPMLSPARYQPDPDKADFSPEAMTRLGNCDLFDWKDRPASFLEADVSDKPKWVQELVGDQPAEKLDRMRKMQLVSMLAVEDAIEVLTTRLEGLGIAKDTVIIYMGDNGFAWGDHGHRGKNCAYEECIRVPLVVHDPRFPTGRKEESFALNVDIAPTLADLGNFLYRHDKPLDGKSLFGLWNGKGGFERDEVPFECWGTGKKGHPATVSGVRTKRWKYVEHYANAERTRIDDSKKGAPVHELYDLQKDPHELLNLLGVGGAPDAGRMSEGGYTSSEIEGVLEDHRGRLQRFIGRKP